MYYFPRQAALLLGVKPKRLQQYITEKKVGRWSHAPRLLMLCDHDLLAIWQNKDLMHWMTVSGWALRPKKLRVAKKRAYVYRYRPYKPIPAELQKSRGGARPGAGRKPIEGLKRRVRGNPWAELLKKEGIQ